MSLLTAPGTSITSRELLLPESTQWVKFTALNVLNRKQTNENEHRTHCRDLSQRLTRPDDSSSSGPFSGRRPGPTPRMSRPALGGRHLQGLPARRRTRRRSERVPASRSSSSRRNRPVGWINRADGGRWPPQHRGLLGPPRPGATSVQQNAHPR